MLRYAKAVDVYVKSLHTCTLLCLCTYHFISGASIYKCIATSVVTAHLKWQVLCSCYNSFFAL